jgi:tripartite-type tricarboxylate transporter receptor subunit TctC
MILVCRSNHKTEEQFVRKVFAACLLAFPALVTTVAAQAQAYPSQPTRWIVPYPPGGGSDFLARTIGNAMAEQTKQQVIIENKAGANTAIAASETARSAPNGYTILNADNGTMVFNSALYSKLSYNPLKDLTPVALLGRFPMILVVGPSSDVKDVKGFIAKAKAKPGAVNYGSAGAGSPHHLAMELLEVTAGVDMNHIGYRGAAPALTDLVGGQIEAMMVDMAAGGGFIKSGKIRPLAVANPTRLPQLPDVPTFTELGMKSVDAAALVGVVAPAGLPPAVLATLNKQLVDALNQPAVKQRLIEFGVEPVGSTPQQYAELLRTETVRWHKLIKDQKISLD